MTDWSHKHKGLYDEHTQKEKQKGSFWPRHLDDELLLPSWVQTDAFTENLGFTDSSVRPTHGFETNMDLLLGKWAGALRNRTTGFKDEEH